MTTAKSQDSSTPTLQTATFAGGCFWCTESDCTRLEGVTNVISGYAGGTFETAVYERVGTGKTAHREAIQLTYDPSIISYKDLVTYYFTHIDPTDAGGQFYDRGHQYTTAIYTHTPDQSKTAHDVKASLEAKTHTTFATQIEAFTTFFPAEDYHQDYYQKNPDHYHRYRQGSGRDEKIRAFWSKHGISQSLPTPHTDPQPTHPHSTPHPQPRYYRGAIPPQFPPNDEWKDYQKPSREHLKAMLTPIQYDVTQKEGTEPSFQNDYWNNHQDGIYVDVVSGEPLFSSKDKFDSGTGWPSFSKPIDADHIVLKEDRKLWMKRTEVRSKYGDSHLGHVFDDGPSPTGKRYCINSAALRFVPTPTENAPAKSTTN